MSLSHSPIVRATLAAAAQFALTMGIILAGKKLLPPESFGAVKLAAFASTILLPVVMAYALGMWRELGFSPSKIRLHPVFLASLATCAIFLGAGLQMPQGESLTQILTIQFFNAFGEELLFRGVIFAMLLSLPRWQGILVSGILFGAMHLMHGAMDASWTTALWKMCITSVAGMMFASVRYATGSLWLVILLHMLLNLCMIFSSIESAAGEQALFIVQRLANVIELAIAIWVIRQGSKSASPLAVRAA